MDKNERVIAFADKTVFRISGLNIKGLNTQDVEKILTDKFKAMVRVIGVTGEQVEMDVYGIDPEDILKDEKGVVKAIACAEGISLTDLSQVSGAEKIVDIDIDRLPDFNGSVCQREKWIKVL